MLEGLDNGQFAHQTRVELHAEVVDVVELEANQVILCHDLGCIFKLITARGHVFLMDFLEAEDVLNLKAAEDFPHFDAIGEGNPDHVNFPFCRCIATGSR